ncbi:hypothetical protein J6590_004528 [Homalodisca vitripennis]|nr:hypothetical protein J6590_004528 [Homalodisca vitripennis]
MCQRYTRWKDPDRGNNASCSPRERRATSVEAQAVRGRHKLKCMGAATRAMQIINLGPPRKRTNLARHLHSLVYVKLMPVCVTLPQPRPALYSHTDRSSEVVRFHH